MKTIPEFKLIPEPVDEEARGLVLNPWSGPEIGSRHKLGGSPDFIQGAHWPSCPDCGEETAFYGQLDTINDEHGDYNIADCGMIYVFFCFDCNEAVTVVQSA